MPHQRLNWNARNARNLQYNLLAQTLKNRPQNQVWIQNKVPRTVNHNGLPYKLVNNDKYGEADNAHNFTRQIPAESNPKPGTVKQIVSQLKQESQTPNSRSPEKARN